MTIPDSVIRIKNDAFSGCKGLSEISIPDSVTSIGHRSFAGCTSLARVMIGSSVINLGNWAFYGCPNLEDVTLNAIPLCFHATSVFDPNNGLMESSASGNSTRIGHDAFSGCFNLASVAIPSSVTSIGDRASPVVST